MKNSRPAMHKHRPILPVPAWDFGDDDPRHYKDVYYPDIAPGESPAEFFLRHVLACAGYETKRIETSTTHPVMIVCAVCRSAKRVTGQRLLIQCFQILLRRAGFRLQKDELSVSQTSNRIFWVFSGRLAGSITRQACAWPSKRRRNLLTCRYDSPCTKSKMLTKFFSALCLKFHAQLRLSAHAA